MSKTVEEWRPVVGYEGLYEVSDWGRVKSLKRFHVRNDRILKTSYDKDGYKRVELRIDNSGKWYGVHRLVSEAFIFNPQNLPCVNHKDEDKTNNCVDNLEWCTVEYNNNYGIRNGNFRKTVYQYTIDGELVASWDSACKAARELGYSQGNISDCCRGEKPQYKGYIWSYVPL